MLYLDQVGQILDSGGQGLYFLVLSLVGSCESSDLCPKCGDVLL